MAKALYGHVGPAPLRMVDDIRRLTLRVKELEAELAQVRADQDEMDHIHVDDEIIELRQEPVLA